MSDIEDNARSLTWWWEQLNLSDDWNSMPRGMRKDLVKKLHRAFIDIAEFNVSENDIINLIKLTDPPTVWDAMLSLTKLHKNKSKWEVLAYLKTVVINKWIEGHPPKPVWQKIEPKPKKQKELTDWGTMEKWNPNNFKDRRCDACGKSIRSDNQTGVCRDCQRQGNGTEHEH